MQQMTGRIGWVLTIVVREEGRVVQAADAMMGLASSGDAEMREGNVVVDAELSERTKALWERWNDSGIVGDEVKKHLEEIENNLENMLERDLEKREGRVGLDDKERKKYGEAMQKIEDIRK